MNPTEEIRETVNLHRGRFNLIQEEEWARKGNPAKWSKKEILGHLVDSAVHNQRRFVLSQYKQNEKIIYDQDQWVRLQHYQQADSQALIDLWVLLNLQTIRTLEGMEENKRKHTCDTGKGRIIQQTLEELIVDYIAHLKHHAAQI